MGEEDEDNGGPDNTAICLLVSALEEAQIADEEGDFEKGNADLVDGAASEVEARVGDKTGLRPIPERQSQAVLCFCDAVSVSRRGGDREGSVRAMQRRE